MEENWDSRIKFIMQRPKQSDQGLGVLGFVILLYLSGGMLGRCWLLLRRLHYWSPFCEPSVEQ